MKNTEEQNHAEQNAIGWMQAITKEVDALKMDWERYQKLQDQMEGLISREDAEAANLADEWDELDELKATAGEFENQDDVRERIEEGPLSVQVRGGWHSPGAEPEPPEEFEILLSTGGPALRIIGDLDDHGYPERPRLQYQDWGTPWTEYPDVDRDKLSMYCACFYFGD